jgi:hypothetical protein
MKYRMLKTDELTQLEEDLKAFLIVNGVHAEEWERLNREQPERAVELVGLFSDTVLQKVYEKIRFAEFRSEDSCIVFRLGDDKISLISFNKREGTPIDLSTPEGIHEALARNFDGLTFFRSERSYTQPREMEVHQLLEQGCFVSTESFWYALEEVLN